MYRLSNLDPEFLKEDLFLNSVIRHLLMLKSHVDLQQFLSVTPYPQVSLSHNANRRTSSTMPPHSAWPSANKSPSNYPLKHVKGPLHSPTLPTEYFWLTFPLSPPNRPLTSSGIALQRESYFGHGFGIRMMQVRGSWSSRGLQGKLLMMFWRDGR